MYEVKERKYVAPEGYVYHKDGRYAKVVYPTPRQSINEYELVTVEERDRRIAEEESEAISDEA